MNTRQGRDFIWKAADWEDGKLPQSKQYWGLDARLFYRSEGKKQWETKVKRNSREGDALGKSVKGYSALQNISWKGQPLKAVYSSLLFRGRQGQVICLWAEQGHFRLPLGQRGKVVWGRPSCLIMIATTVKSKSKKQCQEDSELVVLKENSPLSKPTP